MRSENVKRAELWILVARPPSRSATVEQVERVGLLVRRRRAAKYHMLIIQLLHGLHLPPPSVQGGSVGFCFVAVAAGALEVERLDRHCGDLLLLLLRKEGEVNQPTFVELRFQLRM